MEGRLARRASFFVGCQRVCRQSSLFYCVKERKIQQNDVESLVDNKGGL